MKSAKLNTAAWLRRLLEVDVEMKRKTALDDLLALKRYDPNRGRYGEGFFCTVNVPIALMARLEIQAACQPAGESSDEVRNAMLTALQEVLATPGLQSGLQAMCAAAIARATGRDVADVIKGV